MAKKIINLKDFPEHMHSAINKAVEEALANDVLQSIGDDFVDQLRTRTRLGNSLDKHGGEPSKLKPLSFEYVEHRKTFKGLSELTKPTKSNLTLTGDMLDDLTATAQNDQITITFKNQYSKDKARWVSAVRPFLFISRVQIERLKNNLEKKITELLKKYL